MSVRDYKDAGLVLEIMERVSSKEISYAMREFADYVGEPASHFSCNGECSCGWNCGEDDDCFSCGDKERLYELEWVCEEREARKNE